jgi:dihydropyrimidine dehydrogenase (NAD+) subunit PreA
MIAGLENYLERMSFTKTEQLVGAAVPTVTDWGNLNLNYITKARIDQDKCIKCGRCHIVCEDTSHQAITSIKDGQRHFEVIDEECVGCNLCVCVCPVEDCITLEQITSGVDARTKKPISESKLVWADHPNHPDNAHAVDVAVPDKEKGDSK